MSILVTGGAGYIGSHMVHELADAGVRAGLAILLRLSQLLIALAWRWGGRHSTIISPPSSLMRSPGSRGCDEMCSETDVDGSVWFATRHRSDRPVRYQ